jgi:protocatechuate 3,4-dioxygenase beta subunit
MQRGRKRERIAIHSWLEPRRFPRRTALQGLGALAFAGFGCSSARSGSGSSIAGPAAAAGAGDARPPAAGSGGTMQPVTDSSAAAPPPPPTIGSAGMASPAGTGGAAPPASDAATPMTRMPAAGGMAAADAGAAHTPAMPTGLDALHCIVTPALTEGPFFVDEKLNRANLVMGETDDAIANAVPLQLVIGVFEVNGTMCKPLTGVQVDVWQANAVGVYSDVAAGLIQSVDTRGKQYLRGYQLTDDQGVVRFETIYPGWYMSRTIHIHFKLRMLDSSTSAREFTSQMFFDETMNAAVLAKPAYSNRSDVRTVLNDDDHIYNGTAMDGQPPPAGTTPPGKNVMPTVVANGAGYTATLKIGLQG